MTTTRAVLAALAVAAAACSAGGPSVSGPTQTLTAERLTATPTVASPSPTATAAPTPTPEPRPSPVPSPPPPPPPSPSPTPTPSPVPAPDILRADDTGGTFQLGVGRILLVRLGEEGMTWSNLKASGGSVSVVEVLFIRDPGYREWEVRGIRPGTATLTSVGDLPCRHATPPCLAPSRLFEVTIEVT